LTKTLVEEAGDTAGPCERQRPRWRCLTPPSGRRRHPCAINIVPSKNEFSLACSDSWHHQPHHHCAVGSLCMNATIGTTVMHALGKHSRESSSAIPPWHRRHLVVGERRLGATSYASVSGALTYARPLPATPPPPAAPPRHRQHSPNRNCCHRAQRTPTPQGGRRAGRSTCRGRGKFVIRHSTTQGLRIS
jgi:hypothetical protein